MRFAHTLRFLSLPVVVGLWSALALACSSEGPTEPDQTVALAAGKAAYADDDGKYYCPANHVLVYALDDTYDLNNNGYICEYHQGSGGGRRLTIDDNDMTCKNGYNLGYSGGTYWDLWDFNGNNYVCTLAPKP